MKNTKLEKIYCLGLFLILSLCGCGSKFIAGEGFSVMAELRSTQGKQLNICTIELQNQDGEILEGPDRIPGKFHKVFIVSSHKVKYLVIITCPGFKAYQISATYGGNVTLIRPLRLGVITMDSLHE